MSENKMLKAVLIYMREEDDRILKVVAAARGVSKMRLAGQIIADTVTALYNELYPEGVPLPKPGDETVFDAKGGKAARRRKKAV